MIWYRVLALLLWVVLVCGGGWLIVLLCRPRCPKCQKRIPGRTTECPHCREVFAAPMPSLILDNLVVRIVIWVVLAGCALAVILRFVR
jgi:hypothetical protein